MVFLTTRLWLRNRVTDRYFRVQEVLKHARHFRGRKNRCYRLAVRAVTRAFVKCTRARRLKKRILRTGALCRSKLENHRARRAKMGLKTALRHLRTPLRRDTPHNTHLV
uniref:Mitochondrial ribosomal protein L20 n=1 Tax=Urocitellus parryii TaxID=9999 RepID=A0A8D2HZE8_UROPR